MHSLVVYMLRTPSILVVYINGGGREPGDEASVYCTGPPHSDCKSQGSMLCI